LLLREQVDAEFSRIILTPARRCKAEKRRSINGFQLLLVQPSIPRKLSSALHAGYWWAKTGLVLRCCPLHTNSWRACSEQDVRALALRLEFCKRLGLSSTAAERWESSTGKSWKTRRDMRMLSHN